ncbi:MAG: methyltransferase domain-containing protein [Acidobacteriota bacterium]|nr:methyltransferase domain-containing protein [Acidobacteriota bacterium]
MAKLDFSTRADPDALPELMDGPCAYPELRACLHDLSRVNRLTFAYRPTMNFLARATAAHSPVPLRIPAPLRIVDVGCGYGDTLRRIESWAGRRRLPVKLLGADLNANAIRAAREATSARSSIRWFAGDVTECAEARDADLIVCSLVTHHLREPEIVSLLRWMERTARVGWFICDLHRRPVPYHLFSTLMRGPWWHRFIRPDGLASIRRSFLPEDWQRLCAAAGVGQAVSIRAYRPARLCVERLQPTHPPVLTGSAPRA